jgi:hypothetical protein
VVDFIDRALGSFAADQGALLAAGLADLNARVARRHPGAGRFADLVDDEAARLQRELEAEKSVFSNGGNAGKVGWKVLGLDERFVWTAPFG